MKRSDLGWLKRHRTLIISLCAVVVFITTYLLILPALTLDKDKAEEQGGITVTSGASDEQAEVSDTSVSDQTTEEDQKEPAEIDQSDRSEEKQDKQEQTIEDIAAANESEKSENYQAGELSYKGEDYEICINYDSEAEIPDNAELRAKEIAPDSKEYKRYLKGSAEELGVDSNNISFARFFDIEIISDKQDIEPKTPVQVKITYDDALDAHSAGGVKIVHFADEGVEVIDDIELNKKATEISYEQESFSVTATIVSGGSLPTPGRRNGTKYVVLIENPETHKYYAVENDGSLVEVLSYTTNPETQQIEVNLDYPLEWTYISGHDGQSDDTLNYNENQTHPEWDPYNLRITADARQYNPGTQLPEGSYYRYISPVSATGIDEETPDSPHHGTANGWHGYSLDGHKWTNGLKYQNQRLFDEHWDDNANTNVSNGYYIGADWDNMHITGRESEDNAAIVHMAVISQEDIPVPASNNETVSHIDIAIGGNGVLDVPLAYGTYYYKDDNGDLQEAYTVSYGNDKTLHLEQNVPIDQNDIMKARIIATDYQGNEVPNAYNVTGYTSNQTSPYSPVQVRVEGSFKVTTLAPYVPRWPGDRSNDNTDRRAARLNPENQIFYKVEMDKEVEFEIKDPTLGQLYDMHGNPLSTTVKMVLADGFGYWDERNECPPLIESFEEEYYYALFNGEDLNQIKGRNNRNWKNGAIIDNDWTGSPSYKGDSGMDFVLGNDAESNPDVLAVEVIKIIVDENGNRINPNHTIVNNFSLYYNEDKSQSNSGTNHSVHDLAVGPENAIASEELRTGGYYSGYDKLRDFSINVDRSSTQNMNTGMGVYYDYQVNTGMYYVGEDNTPMQNENKLITDVDGNQWTYKETRVETEYVWRNNQHNGKKHYADGYSTVPEVLGSYLGDDFWSDSKEFKTEQAALEFRDLISQDSNYRNIATSPVEIQKEVNPGVYETRWRLDFETKQGNNGFLEFYVYNVYEPIKYPVYIKKIDVSDIEEENPTGLAGAEFDLYGPYEGDRTTDDDNETTGRKVTKINDNPIVTPDNGLTKIGDLSDGTYYLYETKAPVGFVLLKEPIKIVVNSKNQDGIVSYVQSGNSKSESGDGCVYVTQDDEGHDLDDPYYQLLVTNPPAVELPYTGGSGTRLIYLFGGLLILLSATGLAVIKRRKAL